MNTRVVHLRKGRSRPSGEVINCAVSNDGSGLAIAVLPFGYFPDFAGDEAWFEVIKHSPTHYDFLKQVASKSA